MTDTVASPGKRIAAVARKPVVLRSILGFFVFVVLFGLFGYFILPGIIKSQAEQLISEKLQRAASIGKVEVSPFDMALTVRDFKLMEPQGDVVFASFDALSVNLSAQSLWRLAPVVQAVRLDKPYLRLVRTAPHQYNIDDLLALAGKQETPEKPGEPARFSVYNIQLEGGRIAFEDKPSGASHHVSALNIGLPFISSLHSQVDIFVEPLLSAKVNGTPLLFKGKARPFADNREAVLDLNLDGLDLTRFVDYLPFKPAFKLASAQLETRLSASFLQPHDQPPSLTLSGVAAVKSLRLTAPDGKTFFKLPELSVTLERAPVLGRHFEVARVALKGLEAEVTRDRQGRLDLQRLLAVSAPAPSPAEARANAARPDAPAVAAAAQSPAQSAAPSVMLGELQISGAMLRYTDQKPASPLAAGIEKFDATLRKLQLDTGKKSVSIGEVVSGSASLQLRHDKPEASAQPAAATPPAAQAPASGKPEAGYVVNVGRVAIENWTARLEDRAHPQASVTQLAPIGLTVTGFSTAPETRAQVDLKAAVNRSGKLALDGTLGLLPLHADFKLDMKEVDLLPLQPYVTEQVNLLLTRASLSGKGALQLDQGSDGQLRGGFKGEASLGNLTTVDKLSGSDFLRWKTLYFGGVDMRLQPFSLAVDQVALSDFFARIIIDPSGRINLQDIVRSHAGDRKSLTEEKARAAGAPATARTTPAEPVREASAKAEKAEIAAASAPPAKAGKAPPVRIGKLTLQGGRVRFTDNFIKPNYSASLMDIGGVVSGLSSDPASSATVDLRGQVNSAPLTVAGRINPLRGDLTMDLQGKVRDMELAPLSPYSGRYVGYGIEKGKLSFDVTYKIDNRKLTAENRLILDQLTFGDKVDSPDAPSLPVQLAVALLRDRNGVIDINLPIAGSLDDPQFSMGGIIVKVIVNVITKAVTAPFALLGSLFGGGEELSYLEFEAGRAAIPAAGEAKLKSLAKALAERPALKLDITAHAGADAEIEGMKRAAIDRKVRALKLKNLVARGESAPEAGVVVKPEEYAALLARVYKDEPFPKPRNVIGLQKDLPVAEMEKLIIANTKIDADDLVALGNRRAQAVKDWLLKNGQIPGERVFILATKSGTSEGKGDSKASPSRVDFSLK
ncbi:DUF748 domain-containing protein [Janthinobacterium sp. 17J80-10]|uniref:DUF748 domain-containing protein n=1 Tax=Janthinobacterium sp. 17J80-10 TaxID=2497863 RepID=UPI001005752B|nr:DUF748 domain-containing protein [Janthinobacterium sp. 17J80-10]QAU32689.1 DUF748 domain-containing protein [Janthinobacterium sp. 17J80-10]